MTRKITKAWEKTVEWSFVKNCLNNYKFATPLDGNYEIADAILGADSLMLIEFKHILANLKSEKKKYPSTNSKLKDRILEEGLAKVAPDDPKVDLHSALPHLAQVLGLSDNKTDLSSDVLKAEFIEKVEKSNQELKALNAERLKKADLELKALKNLYENEEAVGLTEEPHYFVYSNENTFHPLKAMPYWINWSNPEKDMRFTAEIQASDLFTKGTDAENFNKYIQQLALARGYDVEKIKDAGDNGLEAMVFGYTINVQSAVVVTLREYLKAKIKFAPAHEAKKDSSAKPFKGR